VVKCTAAILFVTVDWNFEILNVAEGELNDDDNGIDGGTVVMMMVVVMMMNVLMIMMIVLMIMMMMIVLMMMMNVLMMMMIVLMMMMNVLMMMIVLMMMMIVLMMMMIVVLMILMMMTLSNYLFFFHLYQVKATEFAVRLTQAQTAYRLLNVELPQANVSYEEELQKVNFSILQYVHRKCELFYIDIYYN
jgi:hypothetical protein